MSDKLVIVESPSKSKTIEQYLGRDLKVKSSKGHIRDLAISGPGGLGIDIENNYRPEYKVLPEKKEIVKDLNAALKNAKEVYLATDPDREGEAISWHLQETLDVQGKKVFRVEFNEITKSAILEAFEHPRDLDLDLVSSQETRRILDRIIGFKLSKLLQSKIKSKSAGRVQSAALKLITDKEKEIEKFVIKEYYEITAQFKGFEAKLSKWKGKTAAIPTKEKADEILKSLLPEFRVASVETKRKSVPSKPPFTTSTLQQEASSRLNFSPQKTMQIAQKLYEGVQIESQLIGLISYMRTDSVRLSSSFVLQAEEYIIEKYGKNYLGHVKHDTTTQKIQGAHEAIRPTDIHMHPDEVKAFLNRDELQLYRLIYARTLASLFKPSQHDLTTIELENNEALFRTSGIKPVFDGYLKVYDKYDNCEGKSNCSLPKINENDILKAEEIKANQLFTVPPARYSEAKLVKDMEDLGIGRPSTYAQTIQTLKMRKYVLMAEKKFTPTEQGKLTIEKLDEYFSEFVSADYSKKMEETLDEIASGNEIQLNVIREFYEYFAPLVANAFQKIKKVAPTETGETCPQCGSPMVFRKGKYGDFEACGNFPKCKYIKPRENQEEVVKPKDTKVGCPVCHQGTLLERVAKKGRNKGNSFYGCSNYPKCRFTANDLPTGEMCPQCGKPLVKSKAGDIYCSDSKGCGYHQHSHSSESK